MQNQLQKAINLAKKTGDRLIVFDTIQSDNVYVIMSLDEYDIPKKCKMNIVI